MSFWRWLCGSSKPKPPWKRLAGMLREQVRDMRRREFRLGQKLKASHWTNDALNEQNEALRAALTEHKLLANERGERIRGLQLLLESRSDRIAELERGLEGAGDATVADWARLVKERDDANALLDEWLTVDQAASNTPERLLDRVNAHLAERKP